MKVKDSRLHLLLGHTSEEVLKFFFFWMFSLLVLGLPVIGSAYFVFDSFKSFSLNLKSFSALVWLFLSYTYFCFMGKYFLTLSRNPDLVKRYPWQALKYCLTDGMIPRLSYSFLVAGLRLTSFYLYAVFSTFIWQQIVTQQVGEIVEILLAFVLAILIPLFYLMVIDSRLFLLSYIIQDSYSDDNLLVPLSFLSCMKKSSQLISGYNFHYAWMSLAQYLLIYLQYFVVNDAFHRSFDEQEVAGNASFLLFGTNALFVGILVIMFLAVRVKWADFLMEFDREIVDFGDD